MEHRALALLFSAAVGVAGCSDNSGPHAPTGGGTSHASSGTGTTSTGSSTTTSTTSAGVGGAGGANLYGGHVLATEDEVCEGIAGLTAGHLLMDPLESGTNTIQYISVDGMGMAQINGSSSLTVSVTWPANPVAICYPLYESQTTGVKQWPRIGISGLKVHFTTQDGKFNETVDGVAALQSTDGGMVGGTSVLAAELEADLVGTYDPNVTYYPGNYDGAGYLFGLRHSGAVVQGIVGLFGSGAELVDSLDGIRLGSGVAIAQIL
ncbi:MAG: hypothetical protein U0414_36115 [Polyangiaceae bacterium]